MTGNTQRAFIAAHNLFIPAVLPFGTGVIAEITERAAQTRSIRQSALRTKHQWYHILIPPGDYFFRLAKPPKEQSFPVLHRLMSQKSLSVLFYDEYTRFQWQLATFLNDKPEAERPGISTGETHTFFHTQRELILALPSGDSFISLLAGRGMNKDSARITSFFDFLGIAGTQFDDSGETRFLIGNAGKSITITAIHREMITPRQGEPHE
jgi:hypothetical protein